MTTVEYTTPTEMRLILLCLIGLIGCPSALAGEKVSGRALFLATPSTTIPIGEACNPQNGDCHQDPCLGITCPGAGEVCREGTCDLPVRPTDAGVGEDAGSYVTTGGGGCGTGDRGGSGGGFAALLVGAALLVRRRRGGGA